MLFDDPDLVPWTSPEDRAWWAAVMRDGSARYVANAPVRAFAVSSGETVLPVTVLDGAFDACYVAGPYQHYGAYAKAELWHVGNPVFEGALRVALDGLSVAGIVGDWNRVAIAGNWLVSTNLYPALTVAAVRDIGDQLVEAFPDHAVAFRSVSDVGDRGLVALFREAGFMAIPSRQVWWQRPGVGLDRDARKAWKRDFRLLDAGPYEVVSEFQDEEFARLRELYDQLYLGKYTRLNPHFTDDFLRLGVLILKGLRHRKTGRIDGVMGSFTRNGMLTTPVFGYDLEVPAEVGLYRMLSAMVYREAEARGLIAHQSSGAAGFKRSRGAQPALEYTMVRVGHLPWHRRAAWELLAGAMTNVAAPLMGALKL